MNHSSLVATVLTVLFVLALVIFRVLWAASQTASAAGLGRLPILRKSWRRWLLGERNDSISR